MHAKKDNGKVSIYIVDSLGGLKLQNLWFMYKMATFTKSVFPTNDLYMNYLSRQHDGCNCAFFAVEDTRFLVSNFGKLEANAKQATLADSVTDNAVLKGVKLIELPLSMKARLQSSTVLKQEIAKAEAEKDPDLDHVKSLAAAFTIWDQVAKKDSYVYAQFSALQHKLQIVDETFLAT